DAIVFYSLYVRITLSCLIFLSLISLSDDINVILSFPPRRSSDLFFISFLLIIIRYIYVSLLFLFKKGRVYYAVSIKKKKETSFRSEEHTSELQSRENLVCRLLLEKKKVR